MDQFRIGDREISINDMLAELEEEIERLEVLLEDATRTRAALDH